MKKTKNGNDTLTFEEFLNEVRKIVPAADEKTLKDAYDRIASYVIRPECASVPTFPYYEDYLKYIVDEKRHLYVPVYIRLSYDTDSFGFCPQDNPYEILLINEESGNVLSIRQIWEWLSQRKDEKK